MVSFSSGDWSAASYEQIIMIRTFDAQWFALC
jgi:hypothetical protein